MEDSVPLVCQLLLLVWESIVFQNKQDKLPEGQHEARYGACCGVTVLE